MSTSSSLTKVCSVCGQLKPLSAFLQFSDNKAEYGAICADCRKAGAGEHVIKEDDTKSTTGAIIDSKTKVQGDTEKKHEHDKAEELYHEERDEKEAEAERKIEKSNATAKQEMKHRQGYLDKPRFLSHKQTPNESRWAQQKIAEQAFGVNQTQQQESAREEQKKGEIDLTAPVEDTRIAGKIKHSGDSFKRFTALIKRGSPIGSAFEQKNQTPEAAENETPSEFVEKNWGPNSKR